jgi:hypothetical protein
MKVIIEGKSLDIDIEDKKIPLKQVIAEVEQALIEQGKIPNALKINGEELDQEALEKRLEEIVNPSSTLEFGACDFVDMIVDQIGGCKSANENLVAIIEKTTSDVSSEDKNDQWSELVLNLKEFFTYWYRLSQILPDSMEKVIIDDIKFDEFLNKTLNLCKECISALEYDDIFLAGDILRYEVVPAIQKIDELIPDIQKVLREKEKQT